MNYKLKDVCSVIRSKNAGPYELTFDMIFKTEEYYNMVVKAEIFDEKTICGLFGIEPSEIINIIAFVPAKALKITIIRPRVSGDFGESDIYGAQQHGSLMDFEFEQ